MNAEDPLDRKNGGKRSLSKLGFHEMDKEFQLRYLEDQCQELLEGGIYREAYKKTFEEAPVRKKDFKLDRSKKGKGKPTAKEAVLERQVWEDWGPSSEGSKCFLPGVCHFLQSYQVPLKMKQHSPGFKAIDLLGVSPEYLPVIVELKTGTANDTPLRMLVEAVKYGIVVRKLWSHPKTSDFKMEWEEIFSNRVPQGRFPTELKKISLVCLAPREYWKKVCSPEGSRGAVRANGWRHFRKLVQCLKRDFLFDIRFAKFDIRFAKLQSRPEEIAPWGAP